MPYCEVTLSANAGVALRCGQALIWVDALHGKKIPGFSTVSPDLWRFIQQSGAFADPDLLLFTHCHPDHYSRELTIQAKKRYPRAALALPEQEFRDQFLISERQDRLDVRGASLRFARLTHEGEQFADVPNYGCIINFMGFRTLIAGDCAVASPELADFVGAERIDLALLNFPWITLRKGRDFLEEVLRPTHLFLYHLPFAEDDEWGYRKAAEQAAPLLRGIPDVRLLNRPLQTEIID